MRKIRADRAVAATSLLTLALVAAPRTALAEQAAGSDGTADVTAEQIASQTEAPANVTARQVASQEEAPAADAIAPATDGAGAHDLSMADQVAPDADMAADGLTDETATQTANQPPVAAESNPAAEASKQLTQDEPDTQSIPSVAAAQPVAQAAQDTASPKQAPAKNGIPVLTIYIDSSDDAIAQAGARDAKRSYGTFADMQQSEDHSTHCTGKAEFVVPDDFTSEYGATTTPSGQLDVKYLRGRGNSTWRSLKKAYKLAFEDKQELFGMPKNKEWALIANAYDPTLLRNRLTYWLAAQNGSAEWTPRLVPVDLVIVEMKDGVEVGRTECGSYYLSEFVEAKKGRLEIDEPSVSEDASDDGITGDYLLTGYYAGQNDIEPESTIFTVDSGYIFINHTPEYESENLTEAQRKQRDYIRGYVADLDRLIMGEGPIDAARHAAIADMMDLDAAADYWWVQELAKNNDAFCTSSTYLYKRRGGKLIWGPIWDFDAAWLDTMTPTGFNHTSMPWFDKLREDDPLFVALLKERWLDPSNGFAARLAELTRDGGALDRYRDEMRASNEADRALQTYKFERSLAEDTESLRSWIDARRTWVDAHLSDIGRRSFTVRYVADGTEVASQVVKGNGNPTSLPTGPDRDGWIFVNWTEQLTNEEASAHLVTADTTFVANYVKESEAACPDTLFFERREDWADMQDGKYANPAMTFPAELLAGRLQWASSDESVATVDAKGMVQLVAAGDVTITATLRNGVSASYLLHVYDSNDSQAEYPLDLIVPAEITIEMGKASQVEYVEQHGDAPVMRVPYRFCCDDPEMLSIVADGIVKGLRPGTCNVIIVSDDLCDPYAPPFYATIQVTIVEAAEPQEADVPGALMGERMVGDVAAGEGAASDACADGGVHPDNGDGAESVRGTAAERDTREAGAACPAMAHAGRADAQAAVRSARKGGAPVVREAVASEASRDVATPAAVRAQLPQTGDRVRPFVWLACLMSSLFALVAGLLVRKKDSQ